MTYQRKNGTLFCYIVVFRLEERERLSRYRYLPNHLRCRGLQRKLVPLFSWISNYPPRKSIRQKTWSHSWQSFEENCAVLRFSQHDINLNSQVTKVAIPPASKSIFRMSAAGMLGYHKEHLLRGKKPFISKLIILWRVSKVKKELTKRHLVLH